MGFFLLFPARISLCNLPNERAGARDQLCLPQVFPSPTEAESGTAAWFSFWEVAVTEARAHPGGHSPKMPSWSNAGPFPTPFRADGISPGVPVVPAAQDSAEHLVEIKIKSRVFSIIIIIILARVAFPCHFQGILGFEESCCQLQGMLFPFLHPCPWCWRGTETPVRGFGGHKGQRGFR